MRRLLKHLPHPSITIIIGHPRMGKTAKAYSLARAIHLKHDQPIYTYKPLDTYLPHYFKQLNLEHGAPKNAVILVDDAHLKLHARHWYKNLNLFYDKMQTLRGHFDVSVIHTTQQTHRIDKNIIAGVDALVFCRPSAFAVDFERKGKIQDLTREAFEYYQQFSIKEGKRHAYCYVTLTGKTIKLDDIKLPYFWHQKLSKTYGQISKEPEHKGLTVII